VRVVFSIAVLFLFIYGFCLPSLEISIADELKTGSFMSIPEAVLGEPVSFENMIDEHECYPLFMKNQLIGWIHTAYKAGTRIIVTKCSEEQSPYAKFISPGAICGGLEDDLFELIKRDSQWFLMRVSIPDFNYFSNPSFCGTKIAYWGKVGSVYSASIYDLKTNKLVGKKILGKYELETDDRYYLQPPIWKSDCRSVQFSAIPDIKKEVIINLKN
jgi:hypothetical protein